MASECAQTAPALAAIARPSRGRSASPLAVFDAGAVDGGPVVRGKLPVREPFGFHGL